MLTTTRRSLLASMTAGAVLQMLGRTPALASSLAVEPIEAGFFPVSGGAGWYRLNGREHFASGKTPLVVAHGGPGFSHHYVLPLVELADERPVIFWDQLDSGNAQRPNDPANWTVERFVSEIDALRAALKLDRLAFFGNSWGGSLAIEYAATQPPGLVATVISSPLVSTERWIADNTAYREELPEDVQATLDEHEEAGTTDSEAYQDAAMVFYRRHLNRQDPWPEELNRSFEVFNPDLYVAMWGPTEFNATGTLKDYDATAMLSQIEVPALFTAGEFDEATPEAVREFAGMVPNASVEIIEDASHTAFLEQRERYLEVVRTFLHEHAQDA